MKNKYLKTIIGSFISIVIRKLINESLDILISYFHTIFS